MKSCIRSVPVTFLAAVVLYGCTQEPEEVVLAGPTMGTTYSIRVVVRHEDAHELEQSVERILAAVDREMSTYRDDSEVSRFNASGSTEWTPVSPDLAKVVAESQRLAEISRGAFDITVAPLVNLWGFGRREGSHVATDEEVAQMRARCGYRHLAVRESPAALRKDLGELSIDLNGIAPGYAVDLIAQDFAARGLRNFSVELGGEIRTQGHRADGAPWRIAVEHPLRPSMEPYLVLNLNDAGVSTSGDYRQFFLRDGKRYSHTIDPSTGRPVTHALAAVVTVLPTTAEADGVATVLMVLGPKDGLELATAQHWAALFLTREGEGVRASMTPEFERYSRASGSRVALAPAE